MIEKDSKSEAVWVKQTPLLVSLSRQKKQQERLGAFSRYSLKVRVLKSISCRNASFFEFSLRKFVPSLSW